jgi:hypothetical protein
MSPKHGNFNHERVMIFTTKGTKITKEREKFNKRSW